MPHISVKMLEGRSEEQKKTPCSRIGSRFNGGIALLGSLCDLHGGGLQRS